jgi:hypothetical protein
MVRKCIRTFTGSTQLDVPDWNIKLSNSCLSGGFLRTPALANGKVN